MQEIILCHLFSLSPLPIAVNPRTVSTRYNSLSVLKHSLKNFVIAFAYSGELLELLPRGKSLSDCIETFYENYGMPSSSLSPLPRGVKPIELLPRCIFLFKCVDLVRRKSFAVFFFVALASRG